MSVPPERRRRILYAHHLRQQGESLRQIAEQLDVSHATVRSDLQLLETRWSEIAAPAADDLLVELLFLLRHRLTRMLRNDPFGGYEEYESALRYYEAHTRELTMILRETRRLTQDIHRRAPQRQEGELAETAPDPSELSTTNHPDPTISQPEQEIVDSEEGETISSIHPIEPGYPDPLEEQIAASLDLLQTLEAAVEQDSSLAPPLADAAASG